MNLGELWREASLYGRVRIYTSDSGTVSCSIAFNTIKHVELEAKSGFGHDSPESALRASIENAKAIVEGLNSTAQQIQKQIESSR